MVSREYAHDFASCLLIRNLCSTQPPSYDSYVTLDVQDDCTIDEVERLAPQAATMTNLASASVANIRPPNSLPNEDVVMTWNNGHEILGWSAAVGAHLAHSPQVELLSPQNLHSNAESAPEVPQIQSGTALQAR